MPLDQQVGIFEAHWEDAYDDLPRILERYRAVIHDMARERLIEGFAEFGDAGYRWKPPKRLRALLEELADAAVYRTMGDI
jgi:hypothetical protein